MEPVVEWVCYVPFNALFDAIIQTAGYAQGTEIDGHLQLEVDLEVLHDRSHFRDPLDFGYGADLRVCTLLRLKECRKGAHKTGDYAEASDRFHDALEALPWPDSTCVEIPS